MFYQLLLGDENVSHYFNNIDIGTQGLQLKGKDLSTVSRTKMLFVSLLYVNLNHLT